MLRRKLPRKTAKTSLPLGKLYVLTCICLTAVLTGRLQLREGRKADLENHVAEVNLLIREANVASKPSEEVYEGEEESWAGIEENHDPLVDHEDEYLDDDRFTTVTVEAVDVSKDGLQKAIEDEDSESRVSDTERPDAESQKTTDLQGRASSEKGKRVWTKEPPSGPRKRKKKFRYENKAERKATRYKERSGNKAKSRARKERTG